MTVQQEQTSQFDIAAEFDRQVGTLLDLGYPKESSITEQELVGLLAPLRDVVLRVSQDLAAPTNERVPFLLVVTKALVPADRVMPLTRHKGKPGFVSADTTDIHRFDAIEDVELPDARAYVVLDVERGAEYLNVRPDDAVAGLRERGRTPLTVDEGIAFVLQFPGSLEKNHCFSLAASRCGDRRVPALWISKGAPKLGWCWAGNPHTWLGTASAGTRLSPRQRSTQGSGDAPLLYDTETSRRGDLP